MPLALTRIKVLDKLRFLPDAINTKGDMNAGGTWSNIKIANLIIEISH